MGIKTIIEVRCDVCKHVVMEGEVWLDYSYAGFVCHWDCLTAMSAVNFVQLVHENGDQMFVKTSTQSGSYGVELKHLKWNTDPNNIKNVLKAHRTTYGKSD